VRVRLALLLVQTGTAVPASALLTGVWWHDPPNSGLPNEHWYAANLRRVLSGVTRPATLGSAAPPGAGRELGTKV
jgi:hypothetical protein